MKLFSFANYDALTHIAKGILDESKAMSTLSNMSDSELNSLDYSDFPSDSEIDKWDKFKDRMRIGKFKDSIKKKTSGERQSGDIKQGEAAFKHLGLHAGDYTNHGIIDSINDTGVFFKTPPNKPIHTSFGAKISGGDLLFNHIKKLTKNQWDDKQKARTDRMHAYTASTPKKLD